jgi:hypothetical protein
MRKGSKVLAYTRDALLVFVRLGIVIYFLFDPDAFDTFLACAKLL